LGNLKTNWLVGVGASVFHFAQLCLFYGIYLWDFSPGYSPKTHNEVLQRILLFLLLIFFSGCSIQGSLQGLFGYYHQVAKENPGLIIQEDEVCSLSYAPSSGVIATTGNALRECLQETSKAIVVVWKPKCSSFRCVPPEALQRASDEINADLFIVAEYYDNEKMSINYAIERPIFGVDCQYYGTNLTRKYLNSFLRDLIDCPGKELCVDEMTTAMLFEKGELVESESSFEELTVIK
jgi:hypothetical protein